MSKRTSGLLATQMATCALLATIASVNLVACEGDHDANVVYLDASTVDDGRAHLADVSSVEGDGATPMTDALAKEDTAQRDTQGDEQRDASVEAQADALVEARGDEDEREEEPRDSSASDADSEGDGADVASDGDDTSIRALPDASADRAVLPLSQWQLGSFPACVADQETACNLEQGGFTVRGYSTCTAQSLARLWFPVGPLNADDYEVLPINGLSEAHDVPAGRVMVGINGVDPETAGTPPRFWWARSGTVHVTRDGDFAIRLENVEVVESTTGATPVTLVGTWNCPGG